MTLDGKTLFYSSCYHWAAFISSSYMGDKHNELMLQLILFTVVLS
jgi:hypothetical protein